MRLISSSLLCLALTAGFGVSATAGTTLAATGTSVPPPAPVALQLWTPARFSNYSDFVPAGATNLQELITPGDAGGPLTDHTPTTYHWMIHDGTVYAVYRVGENELTDFNATRDSFFNAAAVFFGVAVDGGTGATSGPGGGGFHIGINPHGDGDSFIPAGVINAAAATGNQIHVLNQTFLAVGAAAGG